MPSNKFSIKNPSAEKELNIPINYYKLLLGQRGHSTYNRNNLEKIKRRILFF